MLRRAITFLGLSSVTLAACTVLTNLDGLTVENVSPVDDAGNERTPVDGATTTPPNPISDGDAPIAEAGADAGTARFCKPGEHKACFDFDGVDPFAGLTKEVHPAGTLVVSTDRATSGTNAMRAELPRIAGGESERIVQLFTEPASAWTRLVAEASLYVEAPAWQTGDQNAALFGAGLFSTTGRHEAYLWSEPTRSALGSGSTSYKNAESIPFNRWVRVRVEIDPAASVVRGRIGDIVFPEAPFVAVTPSGRQTVGASFGIFQYNKPAPKFVVYYDDVTLDY